MDGGEPVGLRPVKRSSRRAAFTAANCHVAVERFSCRTQISAGAGRRARHVAEALARSIPEWSDPPVRRSDSVLANGLA